MPAEQGGQPPAAVRVQIFLATDPQRAEVEDPESGGEDPAFGEAVQSEILRHCTPCTGKGSGQGRRLVEFGVIPVFPPCGMVDVLPPSRLVDAERLNMASRVRADPDIRPRWRDDPRPDALEFGRVLHQPASRIQDRLGIHALIAGRRGVAAP